MSEQPLLTGELLPDTIKNGMFLIIGYGESYSTEQVRGTQLIRQMMAAMYGPDENDWNMEDIKFWHDSVANQDEWWISQDFGPAIYKQDVGETDHIEVYRLVGPA